MPFPVDNIRAACAKQNTTIAQIERELKIGNGVIARWERAKSSPPYDRLVAIAERLNTTVEKLSTVQSDTETPSVPEGEGLSEPWIIEAISLLRQLRPENQKQVFDFAQALLKIQESAGGQSQKDF